MFKRCFCDTFGEPRDLLALLPFSPLHTDDKWGETSDWEKPRSLIKISQKVTQWEIDGWSLTPLILAPSSESQLKRPLGTHLLGNALWWTFFPISAAMLRTNAQRFCPNTRWLYHKIPSLLLCSLYLTSEGMVKIQRDVTCSHVRFCKGKCSRFQG